MPKKTRRWWFQGKSLTLVGHFGALSSLSLSNCLFQNMRVKNSCVIWTFRTNRKRSSSSIKCDRLIVLWYFLIIYFIFFNRITRKWNLRSLGFEFKIINWNYSSYLYLLFSRYRIYYSFVLLHTWYTQKFTYKEFCKFSASWFYYYSSYPFVQLLENRILKHPVTNFTCPLRYSSFVHAMFYFLFMICLRRAE